MSGSTLGRASWPLGPSTSGSTTSSGKSPPLPTSARSSPTWRWRGLFLTRYPGWDYRRVGLHMIAVDSLVHNFLHRTGILADYEVDHAYGPRCHRQTGCLGVIQDFASHIDCREFNPTLPAHFPRFIQYHMWAYGGQRWGKHVQLEQVQARQAEPGVRPPPAGVVCRAAASTASQAAGGRILILMRHAK